MYMLVIVLANERRGKVRGIWCERRGREGEGGGKRIGRTHCSLYPLYVSSHFRLSRSSRGLTPFVTHVTTISDIYYKL